MKKLLVPLVAILVAVGAWWGYSTYLAEEPLPEGLIQANGRIEGEPVSVASKYPGRIATLNAAEGDAVTRGETLAELEAKEIEARVHQAEEAVAALTHEVNAAISQHTQAARDAARYADLYAARTATARESEEAELGENLANEKRIAAQAQQLQAEAALDEARATLDDLTLKAPSDGTITHRLHEVGTVIAAGAPVYTLVNLDALHLRVYVPEAQIGRLRLGLPAKVHTDAFPDDPFDATVSYIASEAEFTPKEVQTPDERVKLVYAVKLALADNADHRLTPGIPADAVIRWDDAVAWAPPQW